MAEKTDKIGAQFFVPDFDMKKLLGDMKLPAMPDVEAVLAAHKRNLEALTEANRAALEGAQLVARRHMEILQETMAGLSETLKDLASNQTPATRASKQAELLQKAYESAVANTKELGDLIQKSNAEAMNKLNTRFSEAMTEMKMLLEKK
ncbi:phasin family protein [Acidocella aminolytica]|jgi:phasin family protein|uniref:Transcriptional regulator polyhydroxyalkanoate biosynthesis n=1 Tax=Acidocella aminolytica 101 = DSM 11237 TaxID=1120923 RepID=A0A0D6PMK9_9PROT|nr:TIGR01841 family phasin [Acidocella aminolytica]GAN82054.1 transcriptional regulator polyhydroxyalkanoate biosynthesis [Acidocella aminolytica 101 = DSM 11237]GBQ35197.1 phasin family protein [Acidocella aminolytica 101 = DSM 11237]SHF50645.1 phasin family protein [Acidocella aminolytica 101 = DSM 11237]